MLSASALLKQIETRPRSIPRGGLLSFPIFFSKAASSTKEPEPEEAASLWVVKKGAHAKTADGQVGVVQADPKICESPPQAWDLTALKTRA